MRNADQTRTKIINFIDSYRIEHGFAPTVREIAAGVHLCLSTTQYHLDALKGLGYISRRNKASRSVQVIDQGKHTTNLTKLTEALIYARQAPEGIDVLADTLKELQQGRVMSAGEWKEALLATVVQAEEEGSNAS